MRGRPKRTSDAKLAQRVRIFERREALSSRKSALRLGIVPSTYSRCMRAGAFSGKTAAMLEQALDCEGVPSDGAESTRMSTQVLMRLLHILEEGATILAPFAGAAAKDRQN